MTSVGETMEDVIAQYEAFVARALAIADNAPYHRYVGEEGKDFAMLEVNDDVATLFWPESVSGWEDCHNIESQSLTFPRALLELSDEEFAAWKEDATAAAKKAEADERREAARRQAEAQRSQELAVLAILKAKYESGS